MNSRDIAKLSADSEMHKKHKKRTKKIKAQLLEQIEFYFGDANLQKDRFMKQEIGKHPEGYVAISTIASFNKMKQITDDINLVVKAMKMSSLLEVSEDEILVRRKTPVPEPKNVDAETVYVERLPPYADHDWVKGIFGKFGKVLYVSIPRFKHTGDIKGFAFVEFESAKEAQEAVQMFNKGKHRQDNEPEEKREKGQSVDQLSEQHKVSKGRRKRSHSESEVDTQKHKERKRRRTISESSADSGETEQNGDKKQKQQHSKSNEQVGESKESSHGLTGDLEGKDKKGKKVVQWEETEEQRDADKEKSGVTSKAGRKRSHDDSTGIEENVEQKRQRMSDKSEESGEDETAEGIKKHKKRKRKKKEKKETRLPHLRVISKLEWLELKKEYKNLQREAMKNLKKQLQEKSSAETNEEENQDNRRSQDLDTASSREKNKSKIPKGQKQSVEVERLPYIPGVVLKFHCQGHGITKKELRDKFSSHAPVAYLELAEDSVEGHVRFHNSEDCASVFKTMSPTKDELKLEKLSEEAEKAYWEKINGDRIARYNSKREKRRGTEKVARKAEALQVQRQSHIRFDEGEEET